MNPQDQAELIIRLFASGDPRSIELAKVLVRELAALAILHPSNL